MRVFEHSFLTPGLYVLHGAADYFRLLETEGRVTVQLYQGAGEVGRAEGVEGGFGLEVPGGFDALRITSDTAQTIKLGTAAGGKIEYNRITGAVTLSNRGVPTQAQKTVTNAAADLAAANSSRSFLLVQNKDAAGEVYLNFNGAATAGNGIKLAPGDSLTLDIWCPTGAVSAIGNIASNPNVVIVEG